MPGGEPLCLHVVGARPNFMKLGPVHRQLAALGLAQAVVHTGQHYDRELSGVFFEELDLPRPQVNLEVGSGSHAEQTAQVLSRLDPVLLQLKPAVVIVYGDVNSTLAAALVAVKHTVPVAHVEAGLRSGDWRMPEEINRIVTDRVSHLLFTPAREGDANLLREGVPPDRVHFVGNVMVDLVKAVQTRIAPEHVLGRFGVQSGAYLLATLHRPSNVDDPARLAFLLAELRSAADGIPVLFAVHPRTRERFLTFGLAPQAPIRVIQPLGYLETIGLLANADALVTDSGGLQVEASALGVPCVTLREVTEHEVTTCEGSNVLLGSAPGPGALAIALGRARERRGRVPSGWDGVAAKRIGAILHDFLRAGARF
jgi:UDP-N-acetylglucosamine 2-epimerase (non-hydrolysing)